MMPRNNTKGKYREAWLFLYFPIYLLWFFALEQAKPNFLYEVTNPLDPAIPFCEYFIVPYMLWFPYLFGGVIYFFVAHLKDEFIRLAVTLEAGLTICLLIYTFFPNYQGLRPEVYPNNNLFTQGVKLLQQFDTPTNVCPSIHVFSTVAVCISVLKERLGKTYAVRAGAVILAVFICLSTVFLKQHSLTDVYCALGLNLVLYVVVYHTGLNGILTGKKKKR